MDDRLLDILACPVCKGPLPVRDGVPMMLEEDARQLAHDDPLLER
jgi:uncharacterized protein YbaR (Trm112 family)